MNANALLTAVTESLTTIFGWIGSFINELTNTTSGSEGALVALLPLFAVGIGISVVLLGIKMVKSIVWGA